MTLIMEPEEYFKFQQSVSKKRYDALRAFFVDQLPASEVAQTYGYTLSSFYSLIRDFRKHLKKGLQEDFFFKDVALGRKLSHKDDFKDLIISLRKKNYSVEDIVSIVNSQSYQTSYWPVYNMLYNEGFARLPRRSAVVKKQLEFPSIKAPVADKLDWKPEKFHSSNTGLFSFLPVIHLVIKVDFDLVMSILAHNLYRLLALSLERYQHFTDERISELPTWYLLVL